MWLRNSTSGVMREVSAAERKTLDPNKWVLVTGYKPAKRPEPVKKAD